MRALFGNPEVVSREIGGHFSAGADKIVPVPNWVWFARRCWPEKTDAELAAIANKDARTARRWLSGEFDPPNVVMAALIQKLFERQ